MKEKVGERKIREMKRGNEGRGGAWDRLRQSNCTSFSTQTHQNDTDEWICLLFVVTYRSGAWWSARYGNVIPCQCHTKDCKRTVRACMTLCCQIWNNAILISVIISV